MRHQRATEGTDTHSPFMFIVGLNPTYHPQGMPAAIPFLSSHPHPTSCCDLIVHSIAINSVCFSNTCNMFLAPSKKLTFQPTWGVLLWWRKWGGYITWQSDLYFHNLQQELTVEVITCTMSTVV